jgi:hypothetical protein
MSLSCLWSRAAHGQARSSSAFSTSFSLGRRTSLARLDRAVKARGGSLRFIRAIASRNSTARIGRPPLSYRTASASLRSCWPFSLRRPKLPIEDDPSARNLFLADSDRPHRECPVSRQVISCFCRLLITVHTFTTAVTRSSISSSGRMSMRFGVLEHRVQFLQLDPGVLRRETPAHLRLRLVPSLLP